MLKQRTITGAFITLIIALVLCFSKYSVVMNVFCGLLAIMAIYEMLNATGWHSLPILFAYAFLIGITYPIQFSFFRYIAIASLIVGVALFAYMMIRMKSVKLDGNPIVLFICLLIVVYIKCLNDLRLGEHGLFLCIAAICIGFLSDIFAYFIGKGFGRHKLAKTLSPNKTVEGSLGGLLLTVIIMTAVFAIYSNKNGLSINYFKLVLVLIVSIVLGQFGDLSMSTVKRIVGIKDYGKILPGHGGILDRFDSLLFIVPFIYIIFR